LLFRQAAAYTALFEERRVSAILLRILCACLLACPASARAQLPSVSPDKRVAYDARAVAALDAGIFGAHHATSGLPYRLLKPSRPAPPGGYPLVLVLHGSGAIGTDNQAQMGDLAKAWALPQVMAAFPAYVVVPQFPARTADYTPGPDGILQSHANPPLQSALALVDELAARYRIDRRRIYVTGFSMGASGVWQALLARPGLFAAAVPIAGIAPPRAEAIRLRSVPLLVVHGDADTENPPGSDLAMVKALRAAGNQQVELVMHAGLEHEIAQEVLYGRWWREWLFRHTLQAR
jgi:predicted peptidase